jgi:putative spermidine/putrescine transport system substrate-binding protein
MLSMNAYNMMAEGVDVKLAMPKEGAILGVDTIGINKGTRHSELAQFINIALSLKYRSRWRRFITVAQR